MPRFIVVVPTDLPLVYEELTREMSGEDVSVIVDRRRQDRRRRKTGSGVDRRRTYRRGQPGTSADADTSGGVAVVPAPDECRCAPPSDLGLASLA